MGSWKQPILERRREYTYPNGCHICEVEIDRDTGHATIVRYTVVDDFGRAMNPKLLEGQVQGGTVQGIGQALLEHAVYDPASGQLLSGSFMDYAMPRAGDLPSFDCGFHHVPCTTNPLGSEGRGRGRRGRRARRGGERRGERARRAPPRHAAYCRKGLASSRVRSAAGISLQPLAFCPDHSGEKSPLP